MLCGFHIKRKRETFVERWCYDCLIIFNEVLTDVPKLVSFKITLESRRIWWTDDRSNFSYAAERYFYLGFNDCFPLKTKQNKP